MNDDESAKVERVRLRFARDADASGIGALDVSRAWELALLAGAVPVSYSAGRRRQARITTIVAGLGQGMTSEGELVDVFLYARMPAAELLARVCERLPEGLRALDAWEVGMSLPSLPSSTRWADYDVTVARADEASVSAAIARFLRVEELLWEDKRGEKVRRYDIRALVEELRATMCGDAVHISMRLRCDSSGVGRPDQVMKALGLPDPLRIHRLRIVVDEPSPAREAWRRRGRFA